MGNSKTKIDQIQKISFDDWETIQSHPDYDTVRHRLSRNFAEMRNVLIDDKKDEDDEFAIYQFRNTTTAPIVKAVGVRKIATKSKGICGSEKTIKVLTQHIIKRFNQFPQLTFPESLYCLRQALEGYRVLCKKAGSFQVTDRMMGINNQGLLKVWTNQNFGKNHPEYERSILNTTNDDNLESVSTEKEMVKNVVRILEDKNQEGKFPQPFKKRIQKSCTSFEKCQNQLDDFVYEKKLNIPEKIHPNLDYLLKKKIDMEKSPQSNNQPRNSFLTNTQRIVTETPQAMYRPPCSYSYNPQINFISGHRYEPPPKPVLINSPQYAASSFTKPHTFSSQHEATTYSPKKKGIAENYGTRIVPGINRLMTRYPEMSVPNNKIYNAPVSHINFSYGTRQQVSMEKQINNINEVKNAEKQIQSMNEDKEEQFFEQKHKNS